MIGFQIKKNGFSNDSVDVDVAFAFDSACGGVFLLFLAWVDTALLILCPNVHVVLQTKMEFAYHFVFTFGRLDLGSDKGWDLLDDIDQSH
jgi:hypothetical protein